MHKGNAQLYFSVKYWRPGPLSCLNTKTDGDYRVLLMPWGTDDFRLQMGIYTR
jgi:hypothetical protein